MVPTDEAIITRQMLYSARFVPATCAAIAITASIYLQLICPRPASTAVTSLRWLLLLQQNCANGQCRSGQHREIPLPLGKAGHGENKGVCSGSQVDLRWSVAHIFPVQRDLRAGGCRSETALDLLSFLRRCFLRGVDWPHWRGGHRTAPRRSCYRGGLDCNCDCRRTGLSIRIDQRVQLLSRLAPVIHVVEDEPTLLSSGVESLTSGQGCAPGPP